MSLFKTRDWWSVTVGEDEEFDQGCLCTANVDNELSGSDKIIIGSFQGILRIYNPSSGHGISVEDVVVEQAFKQPIIQVLVGRFSSAADSLKMAILHPKKLAVFNVSVTTSSSVEHGSQYQLNLLYEHGLSRTACNFCCGSFGGVKGKDFLCVQSMDGTLSVFEQESFAFSCFLPGVLLPGPIMYIPCLDSFVTASSAWNIECYRYQVLASETSNRDETQNMRSGKKMAPDWTYNIGEETLDIVCVEYSGVPLSILVLGEHSVTCLTENGTLRFVKKLEYEPSCIFPYASLTENSINFLVGSHANSLMVYQDVTLKWMAKMEFTPCQLHVANFKNLRGGLVGLSDSGRLDVMYLGTDPAVLAPPQVESRDVNYTTLDSEMAKLMNHVKARSTHSVIIPGKKAEDDLTINVHVSPNVDQTSMASGVQFAEEGEVPSITLRIQMRSRLVLDVVRLEIHCPWPLACNQSDFTLTQLNPSTPSETFVSVFQRYSGLPSDMQVQVSATYTSALGGRCITTVQAKLPSKLVLKPAAPVKTCVHKLTIDTNRPAVSLNDLFTDMLSKSVDDSHGAALGFQFLGAGPIVTVLASKTSQRYRLQSDHFECMWLPLHELVTRLYSHFKKDGHTDFKISFDGALPLQEYFQLVDEHFNFRRTLHRTQEMLAQKAFQFRTIQKRLLTRFKDKKPASLQNLDTLLEGTYTQILALSDSVDETRKGEQLVSSRLSSGTFLLNLLLKLWTHMTEQEFKVVQNTVSAVISTSHQQGWEECVDASVTHLLRTVMAKSAKDQTVNPSPLTLMEDTSKLKKHMTLFYDRISKGAQLVDGLKASVSRQNQDVAAPVSREKQDVAAPVSREKQDVAAPVSRQNQDVESVSSNIESSVPDLDVLVDDGSDSFVTADNGRRIYERGQMMGESN